MAAVPSSIQHLAGGWLEAPGQPLIVPRKAQWFSSPRQWPWITEHNTFGSTAFVRATPIAPCCAMKQSNWGSRKQVSSWIPPAGLWDELARRTKSRRPRFIWRAMPRHSSPAPPWSWMVAAWRDRRSNFKFRNRPDAKSATRILELTQMTQITKTRTHSQKYFERAQEFLIEGVNSPSRGKATYSPSPIFLERGSGSHVWDADQNEYVDFMMSFGALIHGHAHPKLVSVVSQAMAEGSHFAAATSAEVEAAERFCRMVPPGEAGRFTNSGSEATMLALRLARAHTGRTKFLKFEGHYHGWYDPFLLNAHGHPPEQLGPPENPARIPDSKGIPPATFDEVVLAPWNGAAILDRILQKHGRALAAVIPEPIMANMGRIL